METSCSACRPVKTPSLNAAALLTPRTASQYLSTSTGCAGFALPFLIVNGAIMFCLPRRRDAQIQGGALHYAKLGIAVARYRFGFHGVSSDNRRCAVATGRYRVLGRSISAVNPKAA